MAAGMMGAWMAYGLMAVLGSIHYIDVGPEWTFETRGPWEARTDHRGLIAMRHPWEPSSEGHFALARRTVELPEDWRGPVYLAFYNSDDYQARPDLPNSDGLAADGFVGHRRKQILVNDVLVWSEDVSDPVQPGTAPMHIVPLTLEAGTRTLRIALVAFDSVGSEEVTRNDFYRAPRPGLTRADDPDDTRFRTTVYWGDLAILSEDKVPAAQPRPSERTVLERHNRTWPVEPALKSWNGKSVALRVSAPAGVPAQGFPIEMGIPFPPGIVGDLEDFRFRDGRRGVYANKSVSATWVDGSVRWAQVRVPMTPKMSALEMSFDGDGAPEPKSIRVSDEGGSRLRLETNVLSLDVMPGDPMSAITHRGTPVVETVRLNLEAAGETVPGTNDRWRVVEDRPGYTCVALEGRFEGLAASYGSFVLYVSVYQDLPYLKLWLRFFNDTDRELAISHQRLSFVLPAVPEGLSLPHAAVAGDFALTQQDAQSYRLGDVAVPADKPFFVQWRGGSVALRRFRELFPKGVSLAETTLSFDLIAGGNTPVSFTPGEAKSHEIWLALGDVDGAQLAATVESPPLLEIADYSAATGAMGPAAPLPPAHPLRAHLLETYGGKSWTALGQSAGLRHFPDGPYLGRADTWSNNYNERMMSLWGLWLATGDRAWFDRATDVCAHLMDVAIVHSEVPGQDWLGAMHGPGANHVAGPWNPMLRGEGLANYGHLTGNPDAETDFLGLADYCVRTGAGLAGASVRHVAGPFSSVCSAYRETGELTFLEAGTQRLAAMMGRVDRRRGVWYDLHGSAVYPGNIPWMVAQLAQPLYTWYQITGDVEAAHLLVGLAESLICENSSWEAPGAMTNYSPNPRYPDTNAYDPFIVPLLFAAFELTEDAFFRDAALAQLGRWQADPAYLPAYELGWHWPWLASYLDALEEEKAD